MLNSNGVLSPPGPEHVRCNCTRTQCAPNGGKTLNSTCNLPYCVQQCTTLVCLSALHTPLTACSAGLFLVQTVLRANLQPLLPQPCTNVSLNSWCTSVSPAAACMSGLFIGKLPIQTSLTGGTSGRLHSNTFCMLWRSMLTAATGIFSCADSTAAFITAGSPSHTSTPTCALYLDFSCVMSIVAGPQMFAPCLSKHEPWQGQFHSLSSGFHCSRQPR